MFSAIIDVEDALEDRDMLVDEFRLLATGRSWWNPSRLEIGT